MRMMRWPTSLFALPAGTGISFNIIVFGDGDDRRRLSENQLRDSVRYLSKRGGKGDTDCGIHITVLWS